MSKPTASLARSPLKEPVRRPIAEDEGDEGEHQGFDTLIPGPHRRSLFKRPKGRLGMG